MRLMTQETFSNLTVGCTVIERDGYGEKVLKLVDGTFLKLFRRKSWLSKTLFVPPAKRFADNAVELAKRQVPCPSVIDLFRLTSPYRSAVHYVPLDGRTLREILNSSKAEDQRTVLSRLPYFVDALHDAGVYFRSLHFGNVVVDDDGRFGLIDISDMRCFSSPLTRSMRKRNYQHLLRYEADWAKIDPQLREVTLAALTRRVMV